MIYKKQFNDFYMEAENRMPENAAFGAFRFGDEIKYRLIFKRNKNLTSPFIIFKNAYTEKTIGYDMKFLLSENENNIYEAIVSTKDLCDENGLFFASVIYQIGTREYNEPFQLTVYAKDFKTPSFIKGGVVYQIFPDRFFKYGDYVYRKGSLINWYWSSLKISHPKNKGDKFESNEFFGGNLKGIEEKLDYLSSLHITAIYLCPIFKSSSNHRYDTADYFKIDELLGTNGDFRSLCEKAKSKGISIILDGVFNHTGSDSIYFDKKGKYEGGAYNNENSPYRSWFFFNEGKIGYRCWWDIDILPKVNCDNKSYKEYMLSENGVVRYWLKNGACGWRLDVADELSDDFLVDLRKSVKAENTENIIIGEVWENASNKKSYGVLKKYLQGNELDSVMNYPLREGIINFLKTKNPKMLSETIDMICECYPKCVRDVLLNFLGTHDTVRIINILARDYPENKTTDELEDLFLSENEIKRGIELLKIGFILLFTLPGVPCIFYGDEALLQGWCDPFNRRPFPWGCENNEIGDLLKKLGKIRKDNKVFREGEYKQIFAQSSAFAFRRYENDEIITVIANTGKEPIVLNEKSKSLIDRKEKCEIKPMCADIFSEKVYFAEITHNI